MGAAPQRNRTPEDPTPDDAASSAAQPSLPWEVWALLAGSFLVAAGYGIVAPALPVFAQSFGVGVTAAAAVVSALPVMRLVFAPVVGASGGPHRRAHDVPHRACSSSPRRPGPARWPPATRSC